MSDEEMGRVISRLEEKSARIDNNLASIEQFSESIRTDFVKIGTSLEVFSRRNDYCKDCKVA